MFDEPPEEETSMEDQEYPGYAEENYSEENLSTYPNVDEESYYDEETPQELRNEEILDHLMDIHDEESTGYDEADYS